MKLRKKIISILALITIISITPFSVYANTNEDIVIESICTNENGIWYPGRIESRDFYITNNKENNISIDRLYIELKEVRDLNTNHILNAKSKQFRELAKNSTFKLSYENTVLFKGSLDTLLSEKGIVLSKEIYIKSNEKAPLNITIDINKEMNNNAQALESIFGVSVVYKVDDTKPQVDPELPVEPEIPIKPDTGIGGEIDKLPQTGGVVNSASLLAIGTIAIGTGVVLNKKSLQEKGGKHHE